MSSYFMYRKQTMKTNVFSSLLVYFMCLVCIINMVYIYL